MRSLSLEDDLGFLIARTHRAMRGYLVHRLGSLSVTFEQYQVLIGLSEGDHIPQHVLAERITLEPSSMTRMLNRMEKSGLVTRVDDEADSRVRHVILTTKGRRLLEPLAAIRDEYFNEVLQDLREADGVEELKRLLNLIFSRASKTAQD
jgi:DNA-binding MarR family transcriptional regulator